MSIANAPAGEAAGTSFAAGERLLAADALVLAGPAGDEVRAAAHLRLRLMEIARIERREHDIAVRVGQRAAAVGRTVEQDQNTTTFQGFRGRMTNCAACDSSSMTRPLRGNPSA